jgi:hypothetical protein
MKRLLGQFLATLIVVAVVVHFICWIVAAVALAVVICGVIVAWGAYESSAERIAKREAALITRGDQQHRWVIEGDERGVYGQYPAAPL